jgi:CRP-like cAMP-binding protein
MAEFAQPWPSQSFLGRLTVADRAALLRLGSRRALGPGRRVVTEGDSSQHVEVLLEGYVKVTATTAEGQEVLLAVRGRGDIIGELAALSGGVRSATVTSCGRVVSSLVRHDDLVAFMESHPAASRHLAAVVGDKLQWANSRRADFVSLSARHRVARVLRDLATVFAGPTAGDSPIRIAVTQPELASIAGLREVTVHKVLREMRDSGVISTGYRCVIIMDRVKLLNVNDELDADAFPRDD